MTEEGRPAGDAAEALIEFVRLGNSVKVTAVDPHSLVEVSIVGDPRAGEAALAQAALRKLRYVLGRGRTTPGPGPTTT